LDNLVETAKEVKFRKTIVLGSYEYSKDYFKVVLTNKGVERKDAEDKEFYSVHSSNYSETVKECRLEYSRLISIKEDLIRE